MKTPHDGANEERKAIRKHVKRLLTHWPNDRVLIDLLAWIDKRTERYGKKPKGL